MGKLAAITAHSPAVLVLPMAFELPGPNKASARLLHLRPANFSCLQENSVRGVVKNLCTASAQILWQRSFLVFLSLLALSCMNCRLWISRKGVLRSFRGGWRVSPQHRSKSCRCFYSLQYTLLHNDALLQSSRCCDNTTRDKSLLENLENKKQNQAAVLSSYASARIYPPNWTLKWSGEVKAELQRGLAQAQN